MKANKTLNRQVFELSRELEFFTEKELTMQIGHPLKDWRITILKELIDNSLDACEVSDICPEVRIEECDDSFSVTDNGPGMPVKVIKKSLNYLMRVSDKQFYVSPTRGQMGNALKTVWAAPFVALGESVIEIEARGMKTVVKTSLDRILQKPQIEHSSSKAGVVKKGTSVKVHWPKSSGKQPEESEFSYKAPLPCMEELISWYSAFNPHAMFSFNGKEWKATEAGIKKWRTDMPTSIFWYDESRLRDLIAAYIGAERNGGRVKTVREFVSEFRGLSGTGKQKSIIKDFSGVYLHDLMKGDDISANILSELMALMRTHSKPVEPLSLGLIGKEHFQTWMGSNFGIMPTSFNYVRRKGVDHKGGNELPYLLEVAFAVKADTKARRSLITGINWSPVLGTPISEIDEAVAKARVDTHDPVVLILHLAKPRFEFTDRGKTRLSL